MIDAKLCLVDDYSRARVNSKQIAFGESLIDAFPSSLIGIATTADGSNFAVWIGEGTEPPTEFSDVSLSLSERIAAHRRSVDQDAVHIVFSGDDEGRSITVARSSAGACPIYVAANGNRLVLSWRYEAAVALLPSVKPDPAACRLYLDNAITHTRNQVIQGTYILWPGEALDFSRAGLVFREIEPLAVVRPARLRPDAQVCEAFLDTIAESCRAMVEAAQRPILELSAGYDSSCVGLATTTIRKDMMSYGVIHDGVIGAQQQARRAELLTLLKTKDVEYPAYQESFYDFLLEDEQHFTCMDDIYRSFCSRTLDQFPYALPDLVVTGIGGDELTKEETFRRDPGELKGNFSSSAITAAMCRYDVFLRRGIWVSNPLIGQDVVDFCRALPAEFRKDRLLNVLTLARSGLSDGFVFPHYTEHFGNTLLRFALSTNFDAMFSESIVGDYGIVDVSEKLRGARDALRDGFTARKAADFLFLRKLEMVLRKYMCG